MIASRAPWRGRGPSPAAALTAAVLGFFVITLDTSIVNVALPTIRRDLGAAMTGLQWVVDGYVVIFAALQLSAGSLTDRVGARRAFAVGMSIFVLASAACGLAPNLAALVVARLIQGMGAALMTPSSLTLIREAYPDPAKRSRALAVWITGGSVAGAVGPLAGGALSLASWRLIFYVNLPVGLVALGILARVARSPRRASPFDVIGQVAAVVAMGGLTYGVIEAGAHGISAATVRSAFAVALVAAVVFLLAQARASHPMVPLGLLRARPMVIASFTGFAFLGSFTGTVFVCSLYLQDVHGQSSLATGLEFLPMAVLAGIVSLIGGRLSERFGPRPPIIGGMAVMGIEMIVLATLPVSVPVWAVSVLMIPLGASGPLAIPATTAVLLESVPAHRSGIAAGVFNTSRQVGAALAVAVFGALLADRARFESGLRESLLLAAAVSLAAAAANTLTRSPAGDAIPAFPSQARSARLASTTKDREP